MTFRTNQDRPQRPRMFMDFRQNPFLLGFSVGHLFATRVRVSIWFPALAVVFCARLGMQLGLIVTVILAFSILVHEFFHVFAARWTGGSGEEIVLWPLGGLAFVKTAPTFTSEFWTAFAGPISNGLLCLLSLPVVLSTGMFWDSLYLVYLPPVQLTESMATDLAALVFSINFKLMLLNLLPVHPLDGSRMLMSVAKQYYDSSLARVGTLWVGLIICIILLLAGVMVESTDISFLGFLLTTFCMQEFMMVQIMQRFGDVFMEESYLDSAYDEEDVPLGPIERWKQRRAEKRRMKEERQQRETAARVDELLAKVHNEGMDSLSDEERRFLQQASSRYRSKLN